MNYKEPSYPTTMLSPGVKLRSPDVLCITSLDVSGGVSLSQPREEGFSSAALSQSRCSWDQKSSCDGASARNTSALAPPRGKWMIKLRKKLNSRDSAQLIDYRKIHGSNRLPSRRELYQQIR